jgi:hypothetical protein
MDPRIGIRIVSRNFPFRINGGRAHRCGAGRQERRNGTFPAAHEPENFVAGNVRSCRSAGRVDGCEPSAISGGYRRLKRRHLATA